MSKSLLRSCLKGLGFALIIGSIIGFVWSLPNYLGTSSMTFSQLAFVLLGTLLQAGQAIALGLICLFAAHQMEFKND